MQWVLYLIGYLALAAAAAAARNARTDEYSPRYGYAADVDERFLAAVDDVRDLYASSRLDAESNGESKAIRKRALSVLSRWRPFGNLGVRMNSIHKTPSRGTMKMSVSPGTDFVSAETRGSTRPMGQPLRWGRKR